MFSKIFIAFFISTLFIWSLGSFKLIVPQGFPQPYIPEDNLMTESRIELGKKLFFDKMLSRDSSLSCATCHIPKFAFTDRKKKGIGIRGQEVSRNTPTLTNVAYQDKFLLDGLNPSLEAQVNIPIHETNEFDFNVILVAERMKKNAEYVKLSLQAYGVEPSPKVLTNAIANYERTLISGNSTYDQYFFQGDPSAMNSSQKRGLDIFNNKLYCTECHGGFNFTNGTLTNNGLYEHYTDTGRMRLFGREEDRAIFKVPTLRNIAVTFPYMHDGSLATLDDVIDHYSAGGKNHQNKSAIIQPFVLREEEKKDLLAFLNALTDNDFLNLTE
jgi:cytochrome c peroxidase